MRRIDRIYVATHKVDLRLTRICVASIRHWYPDLPLFLLKDETSGAFSTREIESMWGAQVWPTERRAFGWGFIKLEPLFASERVRYLILDSDIAFVGPVIEYLEQFDGDFVVHAESQDLHAMKDLYFTTEMVGATIDPSFQSVPFTFNTGQYVATSGLIKRSDFDNVIEWTEPPRVKFPQVFNASEQGVLNYLVLRKRAEGALRVDCADFMLWGDLAVRSLDLAAITRQSPYPALIHWAGLKRRRLHDMLRSDILSYFEREYYSRIRWGGPRLSARIIGATLEELLDRLLRKVIILVQRVIRGSVESG